MTEMVIEAESLTKRFGSRVAVDGVSLSVPRGSVCGIVGPNGAGKTTFMRALLGFTKPTAGSARVLGYDMRHASAQAYAQLGAIIEEPRFHLFRTGRANLQQIATMRGSIADGRIDEALVQVGLAGRGDDRVKTYSLGMRQRLGIARALLHRPSIMVLDEPTNGLDPPGIREMRELMRELAGSGVTLLVSSHILDEMERLCDNVLVLREGRVIAEGAPSQLGATAGERLALRTTDDAAAEGALRGTSGVESVIRLDGGMELNLTRASDEVRADIARRLSEKGIWVLDMFARVTSFEQRFMATIAADEASRGGDVGHIGAPGADSGAADTNGTDTGDAHASDTDTGDSDT